MSSENRIVEDLDIEGMSCRHCVDAVQGALAALEPVTVDSVEIGSARVTYPARAVRPEQIARAVEAAGFRVRGSRQVS